MKKLMLLLAFFSIVGMQVYAQKTVTGTVIDDSGEGVPGVSVLVKGTTVGTMTLGDGTYSVEVPDGSNTLVFSYIGMETQEVAISGNVMNVTLSASSEDIDEVVVTAYGIVREKRETTYQTEKVSSEELMTSAPTRAAAGLVGKVAGMQVNLQDNGVKPNAQILLRGLRSVSGNNEALVVIDGSISSMSAYNDLNPNDIESQNILKGANAAALYGSNAANGALIVVTKKGTLSEKLTVGLNSSVTFEKVAYMPDFQDQYGTGWAGAYDNVENTNWGPRFDGTLRQIGPTFPAGHALTTQMVPYAPVKDNLKDFFQTGNTIINDIYLKGGNETSTYYLSVGDQRTKGIVLDDSYRRNTIRVNASKTIDKVVLSSNISFLNDKVDVVGDNIGDQDRPLYWFVLNTSANIPLSTYKDWENPKSYAYADNYYNAYYQNPYWAIGTNRNIDYSNRFNGTFNVKYDVFDWLVFNTNFNVNNSWGTGKDWRASQAYDATLQPSHSYVSSKVEDFEFQDSRYNLNAIFSSNNNLTDMISLKVNLGAATDSRKYRESTITANNLSIEGFYDVSNGTGSPVINVNQSQRRGIGVFGDMTLGYGNFIFLYASGRQDWTSTLPVDNNSYFYPSVGLSFVATDAISALKNNSILSDARFTVSNSTVYSSFRPYLTNESYSQAGGFPYGDVNGFDLSRTAIDPNIKKEKLNTTEIGMNLSFLKDRISLATSYYMTKTTDLITYTTPSTTSGATRVLTNIGELQGKGVELTLGATVLDMKGFKWQLNANYTSNSSKIISIKDDLDEISIWSTDSWGVYAVKGEEFPQIKANTYKMHDGKFIINPSTGYPIQEEGVHNMGRTTPKYIAALTSIFTYKGFSLSATGDYRTGHVYYEQGSDVMEFTGRSVASVSANRQDFVIPNSVYETSPGVFVENTNIQVQGGDMNYWKDIYNQVKSNYIKDASALKIRELTFSYELPKKFVKKAKLEKLKIGFVTRNLKTWLPADNRFSDPEFKNQVSRGGSTTPANAIGIGGYMQSPPTWSYGFNLNIEF